MIELFAVTRDLADWIELIVKIILALAALVGAVVLAKKKYNKWCDESLEAVLADDSGLSENHRTTVNRALKIRRNTVAILASLLLLLVVANAVVLAIRHYQSRPKELDQLQITEAGRINLENDPWIETNSLLFDRVHELVTEAQAKENGTSQWAIVRITTDRFGASTGNRPMAKSKWRLRLPKNVEFEPPYVFVVQGGPQQGYVRGIRQFDSDGFPGFEIPMSNADASLLVIGIVRRDEQEFSDSFDNFFELEPIK